MRQCQSFPKWTPDPNTLKKLQFIIVQYGTVRCGKGQFGKIRIVKNRTVQYSAVLCRAVQYSTVRYNWIRTQNRESVTSFTCFHYLDEIRKIERSKEKDRDWEWKNEVIAIQWRTVNKHHFPLMITHTNTLYSHVTLRWWSLILTHYIHMWL